MMGKFLTHAICSAVPQVIQKLCRILYMYDFLPNVAILLEPNSLINVPALLYFRMRELQYLQKEKIYELSIQYDQQMKQ